MSTRSREWTARPIWPRRAGKSRNLPGSNVWTIGVDSAKDAIYSKLKVTTPGPGYYHFPIAYQQEFFNQLTSEEVRTRFVRGHPVRYWFSPLACATKRSTAASGRRRAACTPGSLRSATPRRAGGTAAAATITARRRPARAAFLVPTPRPGDPLRAAACTVQDALVSGAYHSSD
jgi:hypothetical protein